MPFRREPAAAHTGEAWVPPRLLRLPSRGRASLKTGEAIGTYARLSIRRTFPSTTRKKSRDFPDTKIGGQTEANVLLSPTWSSADSLTRSILRRTTSPFFRSQNWRTECESAGRSFGSALSQDVRGRKAGRARHVSLSGYSIITKQCARSRDWSPLHRSMIYQQTPLSDCGWRMPWSRCLNLRGHARRIGGRRNNFERPSNA